MANILVTNIGSTSFKFQLLQLPEAVSLATGAVEKVGQLVSPFKYQLPGQAAETAEIDTTTGYASCIEQMMGILCTGSEERDIHAVAFKAVHGGDLASPILVDDRVLRVMEEYAAVAPAHNPPYIAAMRAFQRMLPQTPLVAVFETSFHANMPLCAQLYAVPFEWYEKYGIRRYGFHGASHRYVAETVPQILVRPVTEMRIISCHLGGSSSVCAIRAGASVDTSMGFSPQSGLPMNNRCGNLDPYIIPYIMEKKRISQGEVLRILAERSGLAGLSGCSGDVRDLRAQAPQRTRAALALACLAYEVKKYIGAYIAALEGCEAIAFTGGIGENDSRIRASVCAGLAFLGVELDAALNQAGLSTQCSSATPPANSRGTIISARNSRVKVLIIPASEELIIAREAYLAVAGEASDSTQNRGKWHETA